MAKLSYLTTESPSMGDPTSGCDSFPFPLNYAAPGSGYPIAMTPEECRKIWWRANGWTLSTDISLTDSSGNTTTLYNGVLTPTGNATDELGLTNPNLNHEYDAPTISGNLFAVSFMGPTTDQIRSNAGVLYPHIVIAFSLSSFNGLATITGNAISGGGSFTGSIDSISIPVFYTYTADPGGSSFVATSFTLTPTSFWSYS